METTDTATPPSGTFDTVTILQSLSNDEPRTFEEFEEEGLISLFLDQPKVAEECLTHLSPELFNCTACQYLIAQLKHLYKTHKVIPSRKALRATCSRGVHEDNPYEKVFAILDRESDPGEAPLIKLKLHAWIKKRKFLQVFENPEVLAAVHNGDYDVLIKVMQDAMTTTTTTEDKFGFQDLDDYLKDEPELDWLVTGLLQSNQPCLIGGADKCLKTGITCDLAYSLATGTPFLDKWDVPTPKKVMFFSAESAKKDIQRRIKALKKNRQISTKNLKISHARPMLSSADELLAISTLIKKHGAEVLIVDPLYLTLLAGDDSNASPSDMYAMGDKLATLNNFVVQAGATLILVHHYKKTTPEGKLGLNEFTYTGASSFARQSLHIARREPFTNPRSNRMRFQHHGAGLGEIYNLDIDEGDGMEDWLITGLATETDSIIRNVHSKRLSTVSELVQILVTNGPCTKNKIRELAGGWNDKKAGMAISLALTNQQIRLINKNQYEAV